MKISILLIFLIFCETLFAKDQTAIRFNSLSVDEGLADKSVRAIIQDRKGFIWIGTEFGISRFDGIDLVNYLPNKKNSLSGSYITALAFDQKDNLWIGTQENGVNKFKPSQNSFTTLKTSNSKLSSNQINTLISDSANIVWIGTDKGLNKYNPQNGELVIFDHKPLVAPSVPHSIIKVLLNSSEDKLWIGTKKGLAVLTKESNSIERILLPLETQPYVRALAEDKKGNILIGTNKGLFLYDIEQKTITQHSLITDNYFVLALLSDMSGRIWVGTLKNGVFRLDKDNVQAQYVQDPGDDKSLGDIGLLSIFQDRSGVIWMGTYDAGIHWFDPATLSLGAHDSSLSSLSCLPSEIIYSMMPNDNDDIFIGTNKGLTLVNLENTKCQQFTHDKNNLDTIANNQVISIFKNSNDTIWIGTAQGIDRFDVNTSHATRYGHFLQNRNVNLIKESRKKSLILGTNLGVYASNSKKSKFDLIPTTEELSTARIYAMEEDHNGNFWIGSDKGLLYIDKFLEKVDLVYADPEPDFVTHIRSVYLKNETTLLISIEERGLFEYSLTSKKLIPVSTKYKIKTQQAFSGFQEDLDGNLWLMTFNQGLYKLNPDSAGSIQYQYDDGLVSNYITSRSSALMPDGKLFFGTRNGFSLFAPDKVEKNILPPNIVLTKILVNDKEIGSAVDNELKQNMEHDQNNMSFELTAFHYSNPKKNKIMYRLEGASEAWTLVNSHKSRINYDELTKGKYTFRMKASNNNDIWSDEKTFEFEIKVAPWLSWWAFSIYFVMSILLLIFVIYKRTMVLEKRAKQLELKITQRTQELASEKNKVEQLLSHKNEEFANVSHEFRTPLTLILGPLTQLLRSKQLDENINRLNIVQRNGYRLLRMVDQLLNMETFRVKSITQKSPQASGKIIKLLTEAFADLANEKNIKLNIQNIENINFEFTPDALEKIIVNLLSNAIKYTKSGGTITVETNRTSDNELKIQVTDTGIGIPADKLNTIFERYNRVLDENSEQVTGAGIGLALVKSLVEVHQGRIKVASEQGKGTSITIYLPIIKEVSDLQVNSHSNDEIIAMELMSLSSQSQSSQSQSYSHEIQTTTKNEESSKAIVLVIEDNEDMRNYIAASIADEYRVITAKNGEEGVQIAIAEVPDLIISDIMMPKMDGYQATHQLRSNDITNHIPIILLTARGDRESRLKGWYEKADEYLTKPFDVEELKIRLKNLLDIRNILKKRFGEIAFLPEEKAENVEISTVEENKNIQQLEFVTRVNDALESIYMEPTTSVAFIASKINMSERQFSRKLKNVIDLTPTEYLRRFRLEKSKPLLKEGKSASYAAYEVGFSSHSYFGQCFKAQYGYPPSEYAA